MSEGHPDDLHSWLSALAQPSTLIELVALAASALLAWMLASAAGRAFTGRDANTITFGERILDGVLFPALWLTLAFVARRLLTTWVPLAAFKIAIPVLLSLLVIRLGVKVLQAAFNDTPLIRFLERTISWVAWLAVVLWVSGLLPLVMNELDEINWTVGGAKLSMRKIIEGSLTTGLVLIITLWISAAIEAKLLRHATGSALSLRKAISNAVRALLMFVGLLLALSVVGIDLTALSVLGGAIGVGIGFGLQKLASSYVSGFVILGERNLRIGDTVQVDNFSGVIMKINARCTVIRAISGRESIVPNEMLITSRVENLSLADPRVWLFTNVSVGYDSDVDLVTRLLMQAALSQTRVLKEPGPSVALMNFGADGLDFRLGYWINDPEKGGDTLRSLINLEILRLLRLSQVEIPFPQRVIHQRVMG